MPLGWRALPDTIDHAFGEQGDLANAVAGALVEAPKPPPLRLVTAEAPPPPPEYLCTICGI